MIASGPGSPVVIAGGGPAGMMAGVLLARAGIPVTVLEKHGDFLRDFRGDTVHPWTLEIFHQLGWLDELLAIDHSRIEEISVRMAGEELKLISLRHLPLAAPFIAMMPQWDLLDFLARKGAQMPGFSLRMSSEAVGLVTNRNSRVSGVRLASGEVVEAGLVIAADGRRSGLRAEAGLPLETIGAPMDVFWFRLEKPAGFGEASFGALAAGRFLVFIDRRSYLQCAFLIRKGEADRIRGYGISAFRGILRDMVPALSDSVADLKDWDQIQLLEVALDRLRRWHRPGLLVIGDAAHAMSPIGGVGINVAIQDAVAAANVLVPALSRGGHPDPLLAEVQRRRWKAVTRMQSLQKLAQDRVIGPLLDRSEPIELPFRPLRLLARVPMLRRIPGRIIGIGFDPVKIESAEVLAGPGELADSVAQ